MENVIARNPVPRVRPSGSERRRQIVEAAYDLLAEDGLDGLTIRAVLTRTGLARRAFYESFGGKDDLVIAVFEETLKLAADHYSGLSAGYDSPMERLRFIVTSIMLGQGYLGEQPDQPRDRRGAALSREHMRLAESHPAQLQAALRPLLAVLARNLADGMEQGVMRRADPDRLAALVYNLVSSTAHTEFVAAEGGVLDPVRRKALAEDIWEFCRRAVIA
ncbi:TetR/AcrR family transcriptional regulator [Novosphingobium sp. TH158]|uniref:TetR/AcrR family transcriptional regulator n=1 Tax=Novosphingobium sp. TH158 TaxID=2067455 RepID=UPI000C7DDBA1|nr:TetR/AcrR family transcriptional regulator [Novosphingobium sp. TH158]PLK27616.1 TetR/AcrR family transcriptional regulator [Novosphingobium sp. TH158]